MPSDNELANELWDAEHAEPVDELRIVYALNNVLDRLHLPLSETEQGLTVSASDQVDAFVDNNRTREQKMKGSRIERLQKGWREMVEGMDEKAKAKGDPPPSEMLPITIALLSASLWSYWFKARMRKKGAPPWAAYAVGGLDYSLTTISLRLFFIGRQMQLRRMEERKRFDEVDVAEESSVGEF